MNQMMLFPRGIIFHIFRILYLSFQKNKKCRVAQFGISLKSVEPDSFIFRESILINPDSILIPIISSNQIIHFEIHIYVRPV